ncbi:cell division protein FtsQ [Fulvivirga sp. 29W222]|uniref:Cell division protein FtsQ n=1 Tax=Fulvivirga marina TaxID=2494733 RepID=A0A937FVZ6_9BACT|nr:cell division protein FtsQ [Fulvivirga marina]MBL6445508.1 cell division protein FtsQ [Fulvivirga marina]
MFKRLRLKKGVKVVMAALVLVSVIGFTENKQSGDTCKDIVIRIDNQYDNYFISESDVLSLMTAAGAHVVKGASFRDLNLKEIEERVKSDRFIKKAEIYKDLKGNMLVNIDLRRPFARIVQSNGPDAYIATDGAILPVSDKFSARVVLITGKYAGQLVKNDLMATDEGKKIYGMLRFINNDKFWKAQIAQIDIDKKLNMTLYPQVTKQYVEFGQPYDLEEKFKKLTIFYKQILPKKGWNTYERVNLMYEGQIIAE